VNQKPSVSKQRRAKDCPPYRRPGGRSEYAGRAPAPQPKKRWAISKGAALGLIKGLDGSKVQAVSGNFIQLVSLLLGAFFLILAFRLSRKDKEHSFAPVVIIISAVFFFGGLFHVSGLLNSLTVEQIVCWLVAGAFLVTAFRFLQKEKISLAFTVFVLAALFFFCSLSGVQGLLKTGILSAVTKQLIDYGEKLNTFQLTMDTMKKELSEQQGKIESQQQRLTDQEVKIQVAQINIGQQQDNITNQYAQLFAMQGTLSSAQTNIAAEQKQIANVQFIVDNLYSKMVFEEVSASDTNRVTHLHLTNDIDEVVIKLQYTPIIQSIQAYINNGDALGTSQRLKNPADIYHNLLMFGLWKYDLNKSSFSVQYVRDTRETNAFQKIELRENNIFVNDLQFSTSTDVPFSYRVIPLPK